MSTINSLNTCELCLLTINVNEPITVIQHGRTEEAHDRWKAESIERSDYWIDKEPNLMKRIELIQGKHVAKEKYKSWQQGRVKLMLNGGARSKRIMHRQCYDSLIELHEKNSPVMEMV